MAEALDGLLSFFASHHAIRAEKVLKGEDFSVKLVPGPKELSPNCGVALRFKYDHKDAALSLLNEKRVKVDSVHFYQSITDNWDD